ncbi:hypothetical protein KFE25_013233 [Diacronema lutheri]|uniref:Uncharacterized protein n=1 Tax=Diacronema lutheri TaxID=2081491 RepID=A0A8J5XBN2_DIALT|nr:hypothetical protein KFE25_013233 [Diacronema lutheri]
MGTCSSQPRPVPPSAPRLPPATIPPLPVLVPATIPPLPVLVELMLTILYRFAVLGTTLVSMLLALAVLQALIITVSTGGSIEHYQTISASVGNWNAPQGRLFFALGTFAAILNVMTLQTFLLTPPAQKPAHSCVHACISSCAKVLSCGGPQQAPALWPFGLEGFIRFWWAALQSLGLYVLACVSYHPQGSERATAWEYRIHDTGASLAFGVSFVLEFIVLHTFPSSMYTARRVFTVLGIVFVAIFMFTQSVLGCTGLVPPETCHAPGGTIAYMSEVALCLCLATIFGLTARDASRTIRVVEQLARSDTDARSPWDGHAQLL